MSTISRVEALARVEVWARDLLTAHPAPAHGWPHVERVRRMAVLIAEAEGVDPWLVALAALSHDVGRAVPGPESEHGVRSSRLVASLVADVPLSAEERRDVLHAVRWHNSKRADTRLLCVLRDADMLDGMGAVGLMRAFMSKGTLPPYDPQVLYDGRPQIPPQTVADQVRAQMSWAEGMNTETGRRMAKHRLGFMVAFVAQLQREIRQEDLAEIPLL